MVLVSRSIATFTIPRRCRKAPACRFSFNSTLPANVKTSICLSCARVILIFFIGHLFSFFSKNNPMTLLTQASAGLAKRKRHPICLGGRLIIFTQSADCVERMPRGSLCAILPQVPCLWVCCTDSIRTGCHFLFRLEVWLRVPLDMRMPVSILSAMQMFGGRVGNKVRPEEVH